MKAIGLRGDGAPHLCLHSATKEKRFGKPCTDRLAAYHIGTCPMVTVLGVLAALAFGFVFGRIWQIRRDELERDFALPPVAHIPQRSDAGQ